MTITVVPGLTHLTAVSFDAGSFAKAGRVTRNTPSIPLLCESLMDPGLTLLKMTEPKCRPVLLAISKRPLPSPIPTCLPLPMLFSGQGILKQKREDLNPLPVLTGFSNVNAIAGGQILIALFLGILEILTCISLQKALTEPLRT